MSRNRRRTANQRAIMEMLDTTAPSGAPGRGPDASTDPDVDFDLRPQPLDKVVASKRTFRWPVIAMLLIVGAAAAIGLAFASAIPGQRADERLSEYRHALDGVDTALAGAFDPASADMPLASPAAILELREAAEELREIATAELPDPVPILPSGPIDDLEDRRAALLSLSDQLDSLTSSAATVTAYQEAGESVLVLPPLPFLIPTALVDEVAIAVTQMQVNTISALAELPTDEAFTDYRNLVDSALDAVPDWADRYLLALRREDTATATTLVAEVQARATIAETARIQGLADLQTRLTALVASARRSVEEASVLVG